jgi:hypothetical protein
VALERLGAGMDLDDGHRRSLLIEIDVVRERLRLVRLDELDQLCNGGSQLLEPPVVNLGRIDDDQRRGHCGTRVARPRCRSSL